MSDPWSIAILFGLVCLALPMWPWPGLDERLSDPWQAFLRFTLLGIGIGFLIGLIVGARLR